jgi:hypothetical protein
MVDDLPDRIVLDDPDFLGLVVALLFPAHRRLLPWLVSSSTHWENTMVVIVFCRRINKVINGFAGSRCRITGRFIIYC